MIWLIWSRLEASKMTGPGYPTLQPGRSDRTV
jgi:hypothetical protein